MKKLLAIVLIGGFVNLACMWDNDTLEMENQQFPGTLDLITGNFLRHSPEFHYWRIKNREEKIKLYPDSVLLYDDLAVSYSKLHNNKKAIELMIEKESIQPNLYETNANLGTFYIHDGQFEEGLKYINKAIEINPDAHFGREVYQKYLVEYVLSKMENGSLPLPMHVGSNYWDGEQEKRSDFFTFLEEKDIESLNGSVKGVSGMMKFGSYNSPVLLEALSDLLLMGQEVYDELPPKKIIALCNFKCFLETNDSTYINKSIYNLVHDKEYHQNFSKFKDWANVVIEKGDVNFAQIRQNEIYWILNGYNPEEEFKKAYYEEKVNLGWRFPEREDVELVEITKKTIIDSLIVSEIDSLNPNSFSEHSVKNETTEDVKQDQPEKSLQQQAEEIPVVFGQWWFWVGLFAIILFLKFVIFKK